MSENTTISTDDSVRKLRAVWKIGDKFPINFVPSVEGMIATTKWRDGVFSVVFISPPYERQGGSWADAAITFRTTTALVKKPLPTYDYPFPTDPRIHQEVMKANGNMDMLQEVVNHINKVRNPSKPSNSASNSDNSATSSSSWDTETKGLLPPSSSSTVAEEAQVSTSEILSEAFMDRFISAFSSRLNLQQATSSGNKVTSPLDVLQSFDMDREGTLALQEKAASSSSLSICSKEEGIFKQHKHKKKKHQSSSSSSSLSSSRSSSSDSNVGHSREKKGSGWFNCPFSPLDSRQATLPRNTMKGKHEERKMLREILHTLYSNFTTLRSFVDTLKVDTTMSSFKPFNNDLVWLGHHATYLDTILLHATEGSWKLWNELAIDFIARSFLELVVRASPTRKYPDIIDEKVRRWMRRKRIGVSGQYGAIPTYLSEAKVTEDGIQPKGGWVPFQKRENRAAPFQTQNFKPKAVQGQGTDKKA